MDSARPYILFCAGEDSGDILGESAVRAARELGFDVRGSGGERMRGAGLSPVVPFDELPVSGFGDVLPRIFRFRKYFEIFRGALRDPLCKAFVAIDYPGMNLRLMAEADRVSRPVFTIAPPQIWAWKPGRGALFARRRVAVLFDFEARAYERCGADATRLRHPFADALTGTPAVPQRVPGRVLLLPGSRISQARRNAPAFRALADDFVRKGMSPVCVASRPSLVPELQSLFGDICSVFPAPGDSGARAEFFSSASLAISAPGSATLELALAGTPTVALLRPDLATYAAGRLFLKTESLALPNIILGRTVIPEIIARPFQGVPEIQARVQMNIEKISAETSAEAARELRGLLSQGPSSGDFLRDSLKQL